MLDLTRQQIADRRASRRERIAQLGEGHRRAKLLRDMLRLVAKAAAEFIEEHPPGECPCEFCTGSEAAVANTAEGPCRTAGGDGPDGGQRDRHGHLRRPQRPGAAGRDRGRVAAVGPTGRRGLNPCRHTTYTHR